MPLTNVGCGSPGTSTGTPAMTKNRRNPSTGSRPESSRERIWVAYSSTAGTPRATAVDGGSTMVSDSTFSGRSAAAYIETMPP